MGAFSHTLFNDCFVFAQEKRIQFQEKIDHMKEQGHKLMEKVSDKRDEFITKWEERSREFVNSFVGLFGKDGRIVSRSIVLDVTRNLKTE